jgi:hypothetical protein
MEHNEIFFLGVAPEIFLSSASKAQLSPPFGCMAHIALSKFKLIKAGLLTKIENVFFARSFNLMFKTVECNKKFTKGYFCFRGISARKNDVFYLK